MIIIEDKIKCCGCTACYNACPVKAIEMLEDNEGFLYPKVNVLKCIGCNICENVCPYNSEINKQFDLKECYVAYNKDEAERYTSSSGGMFVLLGKRIIDQGGVVFGAAYNKEFLVEHIYVENKKDLKKLIGSKYMQSKIGDMFPEVKKFLSMNRKVLFVGTTCQISGLKSYLKIDYENLICVDFICLGIPSPKIWKDYLNVYFKNEVISDVNFKDKIHGWNNFSLKVDTNKRTFYCTGKNTPFFVGYYKSLYSRPSCSTCYFKGDRRCSDITLSDCWGYANIAPEMMDNKGLSCVVCHSQKGVEIFNEVKMNVNSKTMNFEDLIKYNSNYNQSVSMGEKRGDFWKDYEKLEKDKLFAKYCTPQIKLESNGIIRRILNKFKKIITGR